MRIYLDSAPAIYTVEQVLPYALAVDARLSAAGVVLVTSELTRMECEVQPLRLGNAALVQDFEDFFATRISEWVPFSQAVFQKATRIRAQYLFKTPDALHLAAATESACDLFLTNDIQLTKYTDLTVEVL